MSKICCLLDACTVINLIHIDQDNFLLKKIEKLDIHINDTVFKEINANVYKSKYSNRNKKENNKVIEQKLTFFRSKNSDNGKLLTDLGDGYIDKIKTATQYTKKSNGELYSTAYALYLSRINERNIFFYTDDYPAKEYFSLFFDYQQIGQIKDSVDLLILLYWLDDKFTEKQLDNALSDLYSQYATEVSDLTKKLRTFYSSKVDANFEQSQKKIVNKLKMLIDRLEKFDFRDIGALYSFFEANRAKSKGVFEILKNHNTVFDLERKSNDETLLGKISQTRTAIKENKIYKWNDLFSN